MQVAKPKMCCSENYCKMEFVVSRLFHEHNPLKKDNEKKHISRKDNKVWTPTKLANT
jgi:hypothetical protein